jgi:hypothetical protein
VSGASDERIGTMIIGSGSLVVDVSLGMSRWAVRIDSGGDLIFARDSDVDQIIEVLRRAKARAIERNKELDAAMTRRRGNP